MTLKDFPVLAAKLPDDVRPLVCNGMGPRGGWLLWLLWAVLRLLKIGVWFEAAANNHDVRYALGGTERDRDLADLSFLEEMLCMVDTLGSETMRGRYARYCAFKAYVAVQELADDLGAFRYRDEPLTIPELIDEVRASAKPQQPLPPASA